MLKIYNSMTRQKEVFTPLDPSHVRMYVCGPTVYDYAHIGNARPYVVFDVLYSLLRRQYPRVTYARNITDVDDKINQAAYSQGVSIFSITEKTTAFFQEDMATIKNRAPTMEPKATAHIPHMINLIEVLISKGHAYEAEGHVLFKVSSHASYGCLSRRNRDEMIMGARVEVAPYKQDPADFVLWKPSDPTQPGWDSPWGHGRPGWHIECSAMALEHLGATFDIHGGGQDLMFPHHENEIAQSTAAHGEGSFARYWMHNGILTVDGEKMSKSLGNFITVRDLLGKVRGEVIRFVLLSTHYRQALDWTNTAIDQATQSLDRLYGALRQVESIPTGTISEEVTNALEDDLNTPLAIACLHEIASKINKTSSAEEKTNLRATLKASAALLGILQESPKAWFQGHEDIETEIEDMIQARQAARKARNFSEADRIRQDLLDQGIALEDSSDGVTWKRITQ